MYNGNATLDVNIGNAKGRLDNRYYLMAQKTKTELVAVNTRNSLRCTVPVHIVQMPDLSGGDHLERKSSAIRNNFKVELLSIRSRSK